MSQKNQKTERKLVEAFKTFFEKSISPYVSSNEAVMNEWKYFCRLISAEPIDYSQVEFYLLLANKSPQPVQSPQQQFRNTSYGQTFNQSNKANMGESDKKSGSSRTFNSPKKKNLVSCLESFQALLLKNQEKLQSFGKKEVANNPFSLNANKRQY